MIIQGIWTHKNNEIFRNHKYNHAYILDYAMKTYHSTVLYNKATNNFCNESDIDQNITAQCTKQKNQNQIPPPKGWCKWNMNVSKLESTKSTTINYICRESKEKCLKILVIRQVNV